jgi:IMP dehydrogenase/GMP reductase
MDFPLSLGFEDIGIMQEKNICKSRLDVDISSEFVRGIRINVPLICSNMSSVIDSSFYKKIYDLGALAFLHRALNEEEYIKETKEVAKHCNLVCCSVGVGEGQFELTKKLVDSGANIIVIDIAHGFCDPLIELGKKIKSEFKDVKLVVGNTINEKILEEVDFADAVKIGVGSGLSCSTKDTAGAHERQFSAIYKFKKRAKELGQKTISDGGIRSPACFVKGMACTDSCFAGSIFARCPESAAQTTEINGVLKKCYFGMASKRNQDKWKCGLKKGTCAEGKVIYLDIGEPVEDLIERYSGALRSGITYAGANNIESFHNNVKFVRYK